MRVSILPVLWIALTAGLIAGTPLTTPGQNQPGQTTGRSVVVGQVVDGDSGRAVPNAVVQVGPLLRVAGPSGTFEESLSAYTSGMRFIVADADGRFVIRNIGKGRYALILRMNGYVFSAYGQKRPGAPAREVDIDGEQRLDDVVILAWKKAVITGVVLDEAGAPAVGIGVRALRRTLVAGQARFVSASSGDRTDDRGEYRISGLEPGDYIVAVPSTVITVPTAIVTSYRDASAAGNAADAGRLQREASGLGAALSSPGMPASNGYTVLVGTRGRGLSLPNPPDAGLAYQTIFHPGVADPGQASVISLRSGEERSGVGLHLKMVKVFHVAGQIVPADGNPSPTQLTLVASNTELAIASQGFETATGVTDESGRFLFFGVPEGEYLLKALKTQSAPRPGTATSIQTGNQVTTVTSVTPGGVVDTPTLPTLWARTPVTVNSPVTDLSVPLTQGARVRGRLQFEGAAPPTSGRGASVSVVSAEARVGAETPATRSTPDHQFVTSQYPPGRYFVSAMPPPGGWWLKSIVHDGVDLLKKPLTIGAEDIAGVTVTLTNRSMGLSGTVRDRKNVGVGDASVALFPADYRTWIADGMSPRVLYTTTADKSGAFQIIGLTAGDYLAVAFPGAVQRTVQDPKFIAELAAFATAVTVQEGQPPIVNLTVAAIK